MADLGTPSAAGMLSIAPDLALAARVAGQSSEVLALLARGDDGVVRCGLVVRGREIGARVHLGNKRLSRLPGTVEPLVHRPVSTACCWSCCRSKRGCVGSGEPGRGLADLSR